MAFFINALWRMLLLSVAVSSAVILIGVRGECSSAQEQVVASNLDHLNSPLLRTDLKITGAQSCASASCHGGPRPAVVQPRVSRGNEFPLWIENDPHSQSWRTFCSDESVAMLRRLKILDDSGAVIDQAGYDNCLACHNSTPRYSDPDQDSEFVASHVGLPSKSAAFKREGVGCSACHGPSERWIESHFQNHFQAEYASVDGFVNAKDLLTRARMCATCHVGDRDRDMNHDLIAAGHPALRYEFATYHNRQPKHWRDTEAKAAWRYEAQLWLAGQVAAMDASLSLLVERTRCGVGGKNASVSRWPELAVYDCAACHHTLGFANQRRPDRPEGRFPGGPMVSSWNEIGMRWMLNYRIRTGNAIDQDFELLASIDQLRSTLQSETVADADVVADAAVGVRAALAQWVDDVYAVERFEFEARELAQLVTMAAGNEETYRNWESTAQYYLAAAAARNAWPGGASGPAFLVANQLKSGLRYADRTNTPRFAERVPEVGEEPKSTMSRSEAALRAVELAAWLGPVERPDLSEWENDRVQINLIHSELQSAISRVNEAISERRAERSKESEKNVTPQPDNRQPRDDEPAPKPRVKSRQELLEELRRRRANEADPFNDD
ncbi:cytochrome c family protein [Rhodopirellula sp. SWK7]|uniref:cytochrome c family protein n=1 Tax=Rhodopirellula sp. SWK7 TaxID=595460 RepID=UPI001F35F8C4|nr:cytochrome c family protein [Rhodopirellula sp. SWK7]